jgi:3-oxoacyl-[acyl-carrier-protein] synthase III
MSARVGLEMVVQHFEGDVVRAQDHAYLEPVIPPHLKGVMRFPDQLYRFRNNDAAEILAEKVARKCLDKAGLKPSDIDLIIANNCGGKMAVPMVGGYVHWKLGFGRPVPVFNLSNACASFVDGSEIAWNLVRAGKYRRILLVMAAAWETIGGASRADSTDPQNAVMGDGAGAAIVSSQNLKCEFVSHYNNTYSECYDLCGSSLRCPAHPGLPGAPDQPATSVYMYGTPEFFAWWMREGPRFGIDNIRGALNNAHLPLDALDTVIFHQPADLLYDMWIDGAEKEGLPRSKWKHTWHKYGNLSNAVVPVNLAEFWCSGELRKGDIMAWITIGAGGHAPTMIAKWLV